jgi:hypothetical protein
VLLMSGYADRVPLVRSADCEFPILAKPLRQASLADAVRGLLDAET